MVQFLQASFNSVCLKKEENLIYWEHKRKSKERNGNIVLHLFILLCLGLRQKGLTDLSTISLANDIGCVCVLSHVQLCVTPWTVAHQTPLSTGFSRQEYWNGLPFPPSGHLPVPGIEPMSPVSPALTGGLFTTEPLGKLKWYRLQQSYGQVFMFPILGEEVDPST